MALRSLFIINAYSSGCSRFRGAECTVRPGVRKRTKTVVATMTAAALEHPYLRQEVNADLSPSTPAPGAAGGRPTGEPVEAP